MRGSAATATRFRLDLLPFRALPALIVVLACVYYALVDSVWGQAAKMLAGMLSPLAVILGVVMHRPRSRRPWMLLLVGQVLWVVVALFNSVNELTGRTYQITVGGWSFTYALLLTLTGYGFFMAAIHALGADPDRRHRTAAFLDAGLIVVGLGLLSFLACVYPAVLRDWPAEQRVAAIAFPLADILMVAFLSRVFTIPGRKSTTLKLVLYGCALLVASDTLDQALKIHEADNAVLRFTAILTWYTALVMVSMAPLHPSIARSETVADRYCRVGRLRLALMVGALLCPWLVVLGAAVTETPFPFQPVLAAAFVQVGLTYARTSGLMRHLREQSEALSVASRTDYLTRLPNRRDADLFLAARVRPGLDALAVAIFDVDHFKRINDEWGHQEGDALLVEAAQAWRRVLGHRGYLARFGGEEFLLVLTGTEAAHGETILAQMRAATPNGQSFSAGLAHRRAGERTDHLLRRADRLLYQAKASGRACTVSADPASEAATQHAR